MLQARKQAKKDHLRLTLSVVGILCLWASFVEAGILEVHFLDQDVRYTLYTLYDGQVEYVHLNKVSQMFGLGEDIDPIDGRIVLSYGGKSASFFPGRNDVIANRRLYSVEIPPRQFEGVIMLPVQFITEVLPLIYDREIAWDPGKRIFQVGTASLEISDVYATPFGDYTRIVVEMSHKVAYNVTEKLPSLLIFELPQARLNLLQNPLQVEGPSVQQVKVIDSFGTTQILVRLGARFVRYTHVITEDPPRLVINVYNEQQATTDIPETTQIIERDLSTEAGQPITPMLPRQFSLRTIVLDPGHGGSDPGITVLPATDVTPALFEKDITLNVAKMLAVSLTQRLGVRVILTREGDDFVSPEARTTIANSNRADVFLSIHVNNHPSSTLSGFEVYIMDYGSLELPPGYDLISGQSQVLDYAQAKYIASSERLAQQIVSTYNTLNIGRTGSLEKAPLFTLKGATMPSVHVEIGYQSNAADQINLTKQEFQQLLVAVITDGIAAFKRQEEQ